MENFWFNLVKSELSFLSEKMRGGFWDFFSFFGIFLMTVFSFISCAALILFLISLLLGFSWDNKAFLSWLEIFSFMGVIFLFYFVIFYLDVFYFKKTVKRHKTAFPTYCNYELKMKEVAFGDPSKEFKRGFIHFSDGCVFVCRSREGYNVLQRFCKKINAEFKEKPIDIFGE